MEFEITLNVEALTETLFIEELTGYSNTHFILRIWIICRHKTMKGYSEGVSFFAVS